MELIEHYDAGEFGHTRIDASTEGVRILDVIRSKEKGPTGLPLSPAAASVLDALEALGDRLTLHKTTASGYAQPIALTRPVCMIVEQRRETYEEAAIRQRRRQAMTGNSWSDWREVKPSSLGIVRKTETRQVPWLSTLREKLVDSNNRKGLDCPDLVRLVIPRRLANDLFGCGPILSFWESQPEPFPLRGPGLYPPPELQGIRQHDADTWGANLTDEAPPRALVRLADLVQFEAHKAGVPAVRPVAAHVLNLVARDTPGLFLLDQGSTAAAVGPGQVWRRRFNSGREHESHWHDGLRDGFLGAPSIELDEAEARGLAVAADDRGRGSGGSWDPDWPELPALIGPAGALEFARVSWAERARTFADLDAGKLGRLAVPLAWAVAKFGRPVAPAETGDGSDTREQAELPPLAVVAEFPHKRNPEARKEREAFAVENFKRAKQPNEIWTRQHFAELLRQFKELTRPGPGALKSGAAEHLLGEIWGMSENSIHRYLGMARKAERSEESIRAG